MRFPLVHPEKIETDPEADRYIQYRFYTPTFKYRVINKLARLQKTVLGRI
jgi:hypothetical protein